jgi:hypothetical protein
MTFLWYRRVALELVSDQRNCQTSGPRLRLIRSKHPYCISNMKTRKGETSRVNCFAAATVVPYVTRKAFTFFLARPVPLREQLLSM